jgi:lipopolysaccharide export system permease protein
MLLQRYLVRMWAGPFFFVSTVAVAVLFLESVLREFFDLLQGGSSPWQVGIYHLALIPGFLPTAISTGVFLSTLFSIGKLRRNREIDAMRAAGMAPCRIFRALLLLGGVLSLLSGFLTAVIVPHSRSQARVLRQNLDQRPSANRLRHVIYDGQGGERIWHIGELHLPSLSATDVSVRCFDGDGHPVGHVSAERASYSGHWTFYERGEVHGAAGSSPISAHAQPHPDWTESPQIMALAQKKVRDLTFFELGQLQGAFAKNSAAWRPYAVHRHASIAGGCMPLVALLAAIPFALSGGARTSPAARTASAIGALFAFYLLSQGAQLLGISGHLPPPVAAWTPVLLAFLLGAGAFHRLR